MVALRMDVDLLLVNLTIHYSVFVLVFLPVLAVLTVSVATVPSGEAVRELEASEGGIMGVGLAVEAAGLAGGFKLGATFLATALGFATCFTTFASCDPSEVVLVALLGLAANLGAGFLARILAPGLAGIGFEFEGLAMEGGAGLAVGFAAGLAPGLLGAALALGGAGFPATSCLFGAGWVGAMGAGRFGFDEVVGLAVVVVVVVCPADSDSPFTESAVGSNSDDCGVG